MKNNNLFIWNSKNNVYLRIYFRMKKSFLLIGLLFFLACKKDDFLKSKKEEFGSSHENISEVKSLINKEKNTLRERISPPKGFHWIEEDPNSFAYYLENFKLKPYGAKILKFDGSEISTQNLHEAVFDIDVGKKDLQQCADAIIRLRAEYLFQQKRYNEIQFHFTNGDLFSWNDYKNGIRVFVNGNRVNFKKVASFDDSYHSFRNYLDVVFNYSGTISLFKETHKISQNKDLKTGDILITPGSPGHVVFISGVCENKNGERLFLLSEGFTPAQSIHLLKNPYNKSISPWYFIDVNDLKTNTSRYIFTPTVFKSF